MLLARLEQMLVDAAAAVGAAQHRLAAIEDLANVVAVFEKWTLELRRLVGHRQTGRRADQLRAVVDEHGQAAWRLHVRLQVFSLVVLIALVQIRELAEHLDAQAREIVDVWRDGRAGDALEGKGVVATHSAIYSLSSR